MDDPAIPPQRKTSALWGTIACGAGLFSDGYLNASTGPVGQLLGKIYGKRFTTNMKTNIRALAFAGTVVGQLVFGWTSDHISRKWSLVVSTAILVIFAIMCTGAYGAGGSFGGMIAALSAYRFLLGIGIGGEYPAGSVGAAEHSGGLKKGSRNRWFILFTNVQIDLGWVLAYLVAMIVVIACTEDHLRAAWRIIFGIGVLPPLTLFFIRLKIDEPEPFKHEKMTVAATPWLLVIKFYWFRLLLVSLIWFIYDFVVYPYGLFSSDVVTSLFEVHGGSSVLWKDLGWSTLLNFFYMPGCIAGAFLADWIGPKKTLFSCLMLQAIVGFFMAGFIRDLKIPSRVGGFVVIYGLFLALGEAGPGDNIGLFASKTSATAVRGKYYGIAAAIGKVGAFVGSYAFSRIEKVYNPDGEKGDKAIKANQVQFFVGAALAIFSAILTLFLPDISQDIVADEDIRFRRYLESHGYDTSTMGFPELSMGSDVEVQKESPDFKTQ